MGDVPWAVALCLLWPVAASAQQPFVVDDAEVTAPRIWHVELSTQFDLLRSTARPALWQTTTDVELDVGVAPRVELAVLVPLIGLVSETPDGRRIAAGIGDTSFGAKMRFTRSPDADMRLPAASRSNCRVAIGGANWAPASSTTA